MPAALRIAPAPLRAIPHDTVSDYRFRKVRLTLTLETGSYTVRADTPCPLVFLPMGADTAISVDGGPPVPLAAIQAQAGRTYTVRSLAGNVPTASDRAP